MTFGKSYLICFALALLILASPQKRANAADLPGANHIVGETEGGLEFDIVPYYLWVAGFNGTLGLRGVNAKIDITPWDYIENLGNVFKALDGLYFGTGQLRYGDFGFFYDVIYWDISASSTIGGNFVSAGLDVGFSQVTAALAATYRFYQTDRGYAEFLAGVYVVETKADVGVNLNVVALHQSGKETWVDPLIGVKGRYNIQGNWYMSGWAMIGGFGAGSDFTWDVLGNVGYEINGWVDVFAGFRGRGFDYNSGGFVWDMTQYGPMFGATIKLN